MKVETIEKAIEIIYKAIPYSNQIKNLQINGNVLYFDWRSERYRFGIECGSIETVHGSLLHGCDNAILMRRIIEIEILKSTL